MDKLIPSYKDSIFNDDTKQICKDFVEIGIDSVLDPGILQSIPFVNVLAGAVKVGQNIYDRNLMVQTIAFINGVNDETISDEKIQRHKRMLDENPQKAEAELGRIIIILNHNVDTQKSRILGILYRNFVDERINWDLFSELAEVTNRLFVQDLKLLRGLYPNSQTSLLKADEYRLGRLESTGLITVRTAWADVSDNTLDLSNDVHAELTSLGKKYCELILTYLDEVAFDEIEHLTHLL